MPDYVYFNHSVHVNRGVSCVECHGQINHMDEVYAAKPLSMTYCLDCHRDPARRVRWLDKITDLDWKPTDNARELEDAQLAMGDKIVRDWQIQSLQNCSTCHR
jgi:nitrate/TMAO reductase-like tetraheme cytochrome c subunit